MKAPFLLLIKRMLLTNSADCVSDLFLLIIKVDNGKMDTLCNDINIVLLEAS